MAKEIATITLREDEDDPQQIKVACEFHGNCKVADMFSVVGQAIAGMIESARAVGRAKGMTNAEVDAAIFGK